MVKGGRRKAKAVFITLGVCVVILTIALNITWILLNWRTGLLLVLGVVFFGLIITGVVLNTIFLIREIRRNEHHDAFINAVTHELKTPVASMRLYLQTLQSRNVTEAKQREFYDIMLADSDRLMGTIEQVLRAARTSNSKPSLQSRIDLHDLVSECVELSRLRHQLQKGSVEFADLSGGRSVVTGDIDELKAAVSNLLDNAIKYSGSTVHIAAELASTGSNHVAVRVRDSGVGIPPSELKRIFRRFYRVPSGIALRVKGTGLGLFIVRSVAERHGGRAWAESDGPGQGSTFTMELPAARNA
ncbi:MAG: HAMP domain-containing histidine kinase [Bryobacteraceae bacterium]|nr:HAMP domain-containing histidine kinase [Bryobacteraceae bacterium]